MSSGPVGTNRHTTSRNGTARHAFPEVTIGAVEHQMAPGGDAACRWALRTDWHATDSAGRTDTTRTLADAGGLGPRARTDGSTRYADDNSAFHLHDSALMVCSDHRESKIPFLHRLTADARAPVNGERMASGPLADYPTLVGTI
jgi:hypothetical protein